jgi:DNA polymerase III delta subunit
MKILLESGVIASDEQIDVFTWVDAVIRRQRDLAFVRYRMLKDNGVDGVNMLGTLYNSWKNILLVTVCEDEDVPNTTGLDSKQVYFASKVKGKYTPMELVNGLKLISKTVSDIKNGLIDEMYSVPYVMCQVL